MSKKIWLIAFIGSLACNIANANDVDFTELNDAIFHDGTDYTYISGFSFSNKLVTYEKRQGMAFFESDIALGTLSETELWKNQIESASDSYVHSIIITGDRFRWPNNTVPYQFGANVPQAVIDLVNQAINHWEQNTEINFVLRDDNNSANFPDFVNIISNQVACFSHVGRRGGRQDLNLAPQCGFGSTVHELGHVLGLWHEQSREDRDNFVQINWENIKEGRENNFNQHINDGDDVNAYDYESIMHYGKFAFSANYGATIAPLQPVNIGQRIGLSEADIVSINQNYPPIMPVANLDQGSYSVYLGNSVFMDGRNSFDPDGGALQFDWNLGDGAVITQGNGYVDHLYENRGNYDVTLTVFDQDGNIDQDTATVVVYGFEAILPAINLIALN